MAFLNEFMQTGKKKKKILFRSQLNSNMDIYYTDIKVLVFTHTHTYIHIDKQARLK
jgi:hypothetical protein